jgi:3-oxoacyl-[acyl-carrier-protein] synthase III
MRKIHIIFEYRFSDKFTEFDYDVVGAFTSLNKAMLALEKLPPETENKIYDVMSIPTNKILSSASEQVVELFSDGTAGVVVENLVKEGFVEPLVGEDGQFYFTLTEEGKKLAEEKKKKKNGGELDSTDS